jgi:CRISPR-associated DxTHG motif protein
MALKIIKKKNNKKIMNSKKAVITILGTIGGNDNHNKAMYYFEGNKTLQKEYFNTFPLLIEKYSHDYAIVPLYTKEAKMVNEKVLQKSGIEDFVFEEKYFIDNEKDFAKVFNTINKAIDEFDELIIDVSHGFRHLPILMIVDLIIQNFKNTSKISTILFAKEIVQFKEYEIIDLKEYLDLANIAFVLSTFEKNYTVASHIKSLKYKKLLQALNDFSNDLMALNLGNLFKTANDLMVELDKVEEVSIKTQAQSLKKKIEELSDFKGKKRYLVYYELSKNLFDKKYMLLSLALLYESIRMYIKSAIKKEHKELVEEIEKQLNNDIYKIGDFFKNLRWKEYEKFSRDKRNRLTLSKENYEKLKNSFPQHLTNLYEEIDKKRNNLAHANSGVSFQYIEKDIASLLFKYESLAIKTGLK